MPRWICPTCGGGRLAPARLRALDVRRYCLACSGVSADNLLVERACPVLDRKREAAVAKAKAKAKAKRARERAKLAPKKAKVREQTKRQMAAAREHAAHLERHTRRIEATDVKAAVAHWELRGYTKRGVEGHATGELAKRLRTLVGAEVVIIAHGVAFAPGVCLIPTWLDWLIEPDYWVQTSISADTAAATFRGKLPTHIVQWIMGTGALHPALHAFTVAGNTDAVIPFILDNYPFPLSASLKKLRTVQ